MKKIVMINFFMSFLTFSISTKIYSKVFLFDEIYIEPEQTASQEFTFEVEDNIEGFVIHLFSNDPKFKHYIHINKLIDPSGEELINRVKSVDLMKKFKNLEPWGSNYREELSQLKEEKFPKNYTPMTSIGGLSNTQVPNHPSVKIKPGTWKVVFGIEKPAEEIVRFKGGIAFKEKDRSLNNDSKKFIKLHIFATKRTGINTIEEFKDRYKYALDFYKKIGLVLLADSIEQLDSKFDQIAYGQDYSKNKELEKNVKLFEELLTFNPQKNSKKYIKIFLTLNNNYTELGLATIAGASSSLVDPNMKSGVFLTPRLVNIKRDNITLAHELGHHLSLYHTNIDLFDDTSDYNHLFFGEEENFANNLMNSQSNSFILSNSQIEIISKNPVITHCK